jgi:hypothetical protein
MKRWASLIGGMVAGVLLTGAGLYAIALLWPRLAGPGAAPTETAVAVVTQAARPTDTPAPARTLTPRSLPTTTEETSFLQELVPSATPTAASAPRTGGAGALPITRLSLQSPFEDHGFDFQQVRLGDGRERWVAASPDGLALVEIVGTEAVAQASVISFGPVGVGSDEAARRAAYMLTMMQAVLPGWSAGAEWFSGELVNAARQRGDYASAITHDGVRVGFTVEARAGSITLSFEPEG